jgi:hypothetical protein
MAKDKTSNLTEQRKTKCQELQKGKNKTAKDPSWGKKALLDYI